MLTELLLQGLASFIASVMAGLVLLYIQRKRKRR